MSRTKRKPVDPKRWPGIYKYDLQKRYNGRADIAYTITYKNPITGKKVWEKIGTKSEGITPQICDEIRSERTRKARHGEKVKTTKDLQREAIKGNRTLGYIADEYFEARKGDLKGIKTDLNRWELHLKPMFESRRVADLSSLDVQRVKSTMRGKADATIWNTLELLRRLCNWGYKTKLSPPLSFTIEMPKRDNEVVEYLTPDQAASLDKVLEAWPTRDAPRMIKIAMLTGMRRGEIFKLENHGIDWTHGLIKIRSPKGGKTSTIPLSGPVATILKKQIADRDKRYPESSYIFPGRGGGLRKDCSAVKRIKADAGLPSSFRIMHGMRHHFAVMLANSGQVNLSMIGELLTHKSQEMTKRYAAYLPETTKAASELAVKLIQHNINIHHDKKTNIANS